MSDQLLPRITKTAVHKERQRICLTTLGPVARRRLTKPKLDDVMSYYASAFPDMKWESTADFIKQSTTVIREQAGYLHGSAIMNGGDYAFEGYYWALVQTGGMDDMIGIMYDDLHREILETRVQGYNAELDTEHIRRQTKEAFNTTDGASGSTSTKECDNAAANCDQVDVKMVPATNFSPKHVKNTTPVSDASGINEFTSTIAPNQPTSLSAMEIPDDDDVTDDLCKQVGGCSLSYMPPEIPNELPSADEIRTMPLTKIDMSSTCKHMTATVIRKLNSVGAFPSFPKPCGKALIINIDRFDGEGEDAYRKGARQDCKHLQGTLEDLDFDVCSTANETKQGILELIREAAKNPLSKKCFVCVIMSHGRSGVVLDRTRKAENEVPIRDIIQEAVTCVSDLQTPKVFIIQACQEVSSVPTKDVHETEEKTIDDDEPDSFEKLEQKNIRDQRNMKEQEEFDTMNYTHFLECQFKGKNVFLLMATIDGEKAYREPDAQGSRLILSLILCLKLFAHCEDLASIFTKVMACVEKFEKHQQPIVSTTAARKLNFYPGLSEEEFNKYKQGSSDE